MKTYTDETGSPCRRGAARDGGCLEDRVEARHGQDDRRSGGRRCCAAPAGQVRSFLQARLLLLLLERPAHGYDLMERLAAQGEGPVDPGLLYRTLRLLEEDGAVTSGWETEGGGPARRLYVATPEGVDYLHAWAANIRGLRLQLDRFITAYEGQFRKQRST